MSHYRKIGKFFVSSHLMHDHPDEMAEIFIKMKLVPLRVECLMFQNAYEIIAFSPMFHEHQDGDPVSEYQIEIGKTNDGLPFIAKCKRTFPAGEGGKAD